VRAVTGDEKEFMNQKKMMMVDAYIAKNHLPEELGQRIRKYFVFQISKSRSMSGSAMQELSPPMFRKVMYFLYYETVSSSPVFANVNPDVLGECVLCIGQQWFMPAEVTTQAPPQPHWHCPMSCAPDSSCVRTGTFHGGYDVDFALLRPRGRSRGVYGR
jgi:hypothetical protein